MRQALAPVVCKALAPWYTSQRERAVDHQTVTADDAGGVGETRQQAPLRAALEDARARVRRLEQENAHLHRELGEAHAARDLAGEHVNRLLGDLYAVIERAGLGTTPLEKTAAQLAGTEQWTASSRTSGLPTNILADRT
ncbi:hypothetical protein [Paraburkholderia sediminicola]|uniref:hypothetical protein n=1 Tax=Paraburkholderia sediminicola TaxID=458836 RepID=UPI000EB3B782